MFGSHEKQQPTEQSFFELITQTLNHINDETLKQDDNLFSWDVSGTYGRWIYKSPGDRFTIMVTMDGVTMKRIVLSPGEQTGYETSYIFERTPAGDGWNQVLPEDDNSRKPVAAHMKETLTMLEKKLTSWRTPPIK